MNAELFKSKTHRVRVTQAELHMVIIISYATMDWEKAKTFEPMVIFPDENNRLPR